MKKAIAIIVFGLLLSGNAYSEIYEMKNCKPNAKRLLKAWGVADIKIDTSDKSITYSSGDSFNYESGNLNSGFMFTQRPFYSDVAGSYAEWIYSPKTAKLIVKVYSKTIWQSSVKYNEYTSNEMTHNCDRSTIPTNVAKGSKVEMASMIDKAKDTCKSLGFTAGTEKFADCSLKLYSQSVELAAKQNQQIVVQGQSSGSNVMTIYDPVRDSNAAIKRGQGLINGTCTLADLSNC
jgi:hypothetical protein